MKVEISYSAKYDGLVVVWSSVIGNKEYYYQYIFPAEITKEEFISKSKIAEKSFKDVLSELSKCSKDDIEEV